MQNDHDYKLSKAERDCLLMLAERELSDTNDNIKINVDLYTEVFPSEFPRINIKTLEKNDFYHQLLNHRDLMIALIEKLKEGGAEHVALWWT